MTKPKKAKEKVREKKIDWNKVILWERLDFCDKKSIYFSRLEIWKGPMWAFHLLRKVVCVLDRLTDFVREIMERFTDKYNIEDYMKFRSLRRRKDENSHRGL